MLTSTFPGFILRHAFLTISPVILFTSIASIPKLSTIFLYSILSDGSIESNHKAFFVIGTFMAGWTVFYGFVQSITPKLISNKNSTRKQIEFWASALTVIPLFLIPLNFYTQDFSQISLIYDNFLDVSELF